MENVKRKWLIFSVLGIFMAVCSIWAVNKVGIKDGATFVMSLILTISVITLARKNIKHSLYLFIISLPILVTARKLLYLDIYILKLNFESILIIYFLILCYGDIIKKVRLLINDKKLNRLFLYSIVFFIIASYISCIFSTDFRDSLALTTTSILVPIILLFLVVTIFDKSDIKMIIYSLIISINLSCLYGIFQILGIGLSFDAIRSAKNLLTFGYHNVNIFVNIALMVYPFLLSELLYKKTTKFEKIFLIISILLQTGSIFITFSRGAWLALAMVCVAIFFSNRYRLIAIMAVVVGAIVVSLMIPTIINRGNEGQKFLENTSNTARIFAIYTSKEIIQDNILGVGYGKFNENYRNYVIDGYYNIKEGERKQINVPLYTLDHPHNFLLAIGTELGIVALISIVLIFAERIWRSAERFNDNRAIFISILIFLFIGLTTGIELNHRGVITNTYLLWIFFGLITINSYDKINC